MKQEMIEKVLREISKLLYSIGYLEKEVKRIVRDTLKEHTVDRKTDWRAVIIAIMNRGCSQAEMNANDAMAPDCFVGDCGDMLRLSGDCLTNTAKLAEFLRPKYLED